MMPGYRLVSPRLDPDVIKKLNQPTEPVHPWIGSIAVKWQLAGLDTGLVAFLWTRTRTGKGAEPASATDTPRQFVEEPLKVACAPDSCHPCVSFHAAVAVCILPQVLA